MAAVTARYARAFADAIFGLKLDAVQAQTDVARMAAIVASSPELRSLMDNPAVPIAQKLNLIDALVAQAGVSKQVRNFIAILVDKHRLRLLPEVAAQLKAEINQRLGVAEAEVASARELGAEERGLLEAKLKQVTNKIIQAQYARDPGILGGATVRIGSTIFDGSVRGQLRKLREKLAE
ncbi:MAG: ATP synthase F1 subunit delta [Acidobacteriales bacterium]|nr:ATP synthase F1 subunit delta [Terriglobales bacterium]